MARSQLQNLFKASLESQEEELEVVGGVDSMEAEMLSIEEARQEMDEASDDVEELEEIADGLEAILVSVESAQENGGLDAQSAQMMQLAVGAYTRRLGLEASEITPSLESFGGDTGRQSATAVSMENIGQTVRNIMNAIKTAVERAIKAVTDFFAKIFGGVDKVLKRIEALEKQVKDTKGSASGDMNVTGATFLHVGGKTDIAAIKGGLKKLDEIGGYIYGDYVAGAKKYYDTIAGKFKASDVQKADDDGKVDDAVKAGEDAAEAAGTKVAKIRSHEFSGGKVFEQDGDSKMWKLVEKTKAPTGEQKISVPGKSDLSEILGTCKSIANRIKGSKTPIEQLQKERKDALKEAEGFVKAAEGNRLGKAWNQGKASVMLRMTQRDLSRPVSQVTSHSFGTLRSALGLVENALKQYKEGDAA